jgi:hypothetical protein
MKISNHHLTTSHPDGLVEGCRASARPINQIPLGGSWFKSGLGGAPTTVGLEDDFFFCYFFFNIQRLINKFFFMLF